MHISLLFFYYFFSFNVLISVFLFYWIMNSHWIRQLGFNLPRQQWFLLNRFRTEQGHCGACRRKWRFTDTDLCPCGEIQTMFHIVESCPLTKLNGGLSRLHSADEDAVSRLTSYGSWHAYQKKKTEARQIRICSRKYLLTWRQQITQGCYPQIKRAVESQLLRIYECP